MKKIHLPSDMKGAVCAVINDPLTTIYPFELTCLRCKKIVRDYQSKGYEFDLVDGWIAKGWQSEPSGFICSVCGDTIMKGTEVWIESYAPEGEPQEVTAHERCRHHTCEGMTGAH